MILELFFAAQCIALGGFIVISPSLSIVNVNISFRFRLKLRIVLKVDNVQTTQFDNRKRKSSRSAVNQQHSELPD